jgi:hypothetical protein
MRACSAAAGAGNHRKRLGVLETAPDQPVIALKGPAGFFAVLTGLSVDRASKQYHAAEAGQSPGTRRAATSQMPGEPDASAHLQRRQAGWGHP